MPIEKLKGDYPPYVLSDKINEIVEHQNRIEEVQKLILGAMIMDTIDIKTLDKINEILNKE